MREIMTETTPDVDVKEASPKKLEAWLQESARIMARHSIGQTPVPIDLENASELQVADYLSTVEVDDTNLAREIEENLEKNPTDLDTAFQATSLAVAKAVAAKEVTPAKGKGRLERFVQNLVQPISKQIAYSPARRELLKRVVPASLALVATACGFDAQTNVPFPPEPSAESAATTVAEITQIAPNPTEAVEGTVSSARLLTEQEIQDGLLSYQPFNEFYQFFQDQVRANPELHDEIATFGLVAFRVTTNQGEFIYPFISVVADPENPQGKTFTAMVIDLDGEGYRAVSLERMTMTGPDGQEYTVLALTKDGYGNPFANPIPIFAVPISELENPDADVIFNPFGAFRPDSSRVKLASLTEIEPQITPEAPPLPPESFTENRAVLIREGYRVEYIEGAWRLVTGETENPTEVAVSPDSQSILIRTVDNQELTFPQEAFIPRRVSGIDTKLILTVENEQDRVEYFYLEGTGWVTPIEVQTNPENVDEYTPITPEDVWTGRLLYSELLVAEPFPEGTVIPEGFLYLGKWLPVGYRVVLSPHEDTGGQKYDEVINENNTFRRWVGFYKIATSEGEVFVLSQQILSPNGRDSLFLHESIGVWWESFITGEDAYLKNPPSYWDVFWLYYIDSEDRMGCEDFFTAAECGLYEQPQNDLYVLLPQDVKENIENRADLQAPPYSYLGQILGEAGEELDDFQRRLLPGRS